MKVSISQVTLAALLLGAFSGCQSGLSAPRWDWWRSASNNVAPPDSVLAGSPAGVKLPSQIAQPQVTLPGENSTYAGLGVPSNVALTTSVPETQASYTAAGGYPGTPYPNTNYPNYTSTSPSYPDASVSYTGRSPSGVTPVANHGSGSRTADTSVTAQVGPYRSPSDSSTTPDYASRQVQPAASIAVSETPAGNTIPPVTHTSGAGTPSSFGGTGIPGGGSMASPVASGGSALGPRYANLGHSSTGIETRYDNGTAVGGTHVGTAPASGVHVPADSTFAPGTTGYRPGESDFNPPNVPEYQTPGGGAATLGGASVTTPAPVSPSPFLPAGTSRYLPSGPTTGSVPVATGSYPSTGL